MAHAFNIAQAASHIDQKNNISQLLDNPIHKASPFVVMAGKLDARISHGNHQISKIKYKLAKEWSCSAKSVRNSERPVYGVALSIDHVFDFDPLKCHKERNAQIYQALIIRPQIRKLQKDMASYGINAFQLSHEPLEHFDRNFYQDILFVPYNKVITLNKPPHTVYEEADTHSIDRVLSYALQRGILTYDDQEVMDTFSLKSVVSAWSKDEYAEISPVQYEKDRMFLYRDNLSQEDILEQGSRVLDFDL